MAAELPQRLKQQLGAILEIAPNKEVPMVKEAIENGFYRGGLSLLDAQKALIGFSDFKELETGLKTKDTYNPDDFNKVLNGLMNNKGALYERVKLAVWNNDLKYLDPTIPETPAAGTPRGELVPPKPLTAQQPPPVLPSPAQPAAQQEKKAAPLGEHKRPTSVTNRQKTPDQEEQQEENQPPQENQTRQITQTPQQERVNPLPQRPPRIEPQISKISRRGSSPSTQSRRNPLPRFSIPAPVRSAGLNMASGSQIAARKGLSKGLGGLGNILGNVPKSLGSFLGSPGGGSPPGGFGRGRIPGLPGRGGGGFFGSGRGGGVRSLAKKGIGRWLIVALIFLILFAAIGGFFGGFGTDKGCPKNSVTLQKEVTGATKASNFYVIENGQKINYTITAQGSCGQDFTIEDTLPSNVDLVAGSVTQGGIVKDRKITWKFPTIVSSKKLAYSVIPNRDNTWVVNEAIVKFNVVTSSLLGGSCPTDEAIKNNKGSPETCQYLRPAVNLFDNSISGNQIETYVKNYSSVFVNGGVGDENEFRRRTQYIISSAQSVGLNPVLFLGYWKSESAFGTIRNAATLGCAPGTGVKSFEQEVNCAVGLSSDGSHRGGSFSAQCASPNNTPEGQNSACEMLRQIRQKYPEKYANIPVSFPIQTIDDFAETYGSRAPNLGDAAVNNNCVHTYNTLLEVVSELNSCRPSTAGTIFNPSGSPTKCGGDPVSFGIVKKFLPLPEENNCSSTATGACGRPGSCITPRKIVLHTTFGDKDAEGTYEYFATGAGNRGVGAHFIIGKEGESIQLVETLDQGVEVAYAVANYSDHISIEMVHNGIYNSKEEVPTQQYQSTIKLIRDLMTRYNIPLGNLEHDWQSSSDINPGNIPTGVYGHYQLNPSNRTDPGIGLLRDIRNDLK